MRNIRRFTAGADGLRRGVRDDRQLLILRHRVAQLHLDVCQMLVLGHPAVRVRDLHMAFRNLHDRAIGGGCDPEVRSVLPFSHVIMRCKVDGAAIQIIMRTAQRAVAAVIEPIERHPGKSLFPR